MKAFQRFWRRGKIRLLRLAYRMPKINLYRITEEKWDYLIILDACRFDTFKKCNNIPGALYKIISSGTNTGEWIRNTFSKPLKLKDVIYVSATPNISYFRLGKLVGHDPFYKIIEVWKDFWSEELGTVHPSTVNEATLVSLKIHRGKRHIIHYMQPHCPFIGDIKIKETGRTIDAILYSPKRKREIETVWEMLRAKKISLDIAKRAYESNLKLVLKYVKNLLPHLKGKICITSDHGNLFGEYGLYGHPPRVYVPELLQVPLLVIQQ